MGRRYYCDYCNRSFPDSAENRKKHLNGIQHQRLRKLHYDSFRDAATILEEERAKKPCRRFHQTGHCDYGPGCKYSHMKPEDICRLQEQAEQERLAKEHRLVATLNLLDIRSWVEKRAKKLQQKQNIGTNDQVAEMAPPSVPDVLSAVSNIPPSLLPAKSEDFLNGQHIDWEAS